MSAAVKNEVAFLGFRTQRLELPKAYTAFDGASITLDRIEDFPHFRSIGGLRAALGGQGISHGP
ncbi:hypothetical protein P4131_24990 [Pseudomonas aeruginosa]|nr:hypothetical protein [Pseudomonas aeruginosa]